MKWITALIILIVVAIVVGASIFVYINYLGTGTLQIDMTDPPTEWAIASQVYLNYSAIQVHRADAGNESGWFTIVESAGFLNLTKMLDVNETIGSNNLQTGLYNQMRFNITAANVTVAGFNYTASVSSGVVKITITEGGIQVNSGQTSKLLIELNIRVEGTVSSGFRIVPDVRAKPE